jgi:quinol monooxygenase YgiN
MAPATEPRTLQSEALVETKPVVFYELHQDADAFEEHRNGATIARFHEEAPGIIVKISGTRSALSE